MYAQQGFKINCSYPKGGCVQPGVVDITMPDGTVLEFCEYHDPKVRWEMPQWEQAYAQKLQAKADAAAMEQQLLTDPADEEDEDDDIDAILEEEKQSKPDMDFSALELDDDDDF